MERIDITKIPMNERTDEVWLRYKIQCYEGALDLVSGVQRKDVEGMNDKMYAIKAIMIELEPLRREYVSRYGFQETCKGRKVRTNTHDKG